ncbi:hypothetical protein HDU79_002655 [Rhizoclosmatium sp. JEL0117]|nr:hypothetical protein HDU79_002655 [Rhizoclosmatium sp. JEL0117]
MHLLVLALLVLQAATIDVGKRVTGHWGPGMSNFTSYCNHTYQLIQQETCQQLATQINMLFKDFASLNEGNPYVDCADSRNSVWPPVVVCVGTSVFQNEKGDAFNGTTGAKIILPGAGSSNMPTWNGTIPGRRNTTTIAASVKTSSIVNTTSVAVTTAAAAGTGTDTPPVVTTDPVITTTPEVIATTDPAPPPPTPEPSPDPPPAPVLLPPCSIYDGSCIVRAQYDNPPNYRGYDPSIECTYLANYARQVYNPGVWDLWWDQNLQPYAMRSATYSATYQCSHCHTESGPGYSWGQNLYLSMCSCSDAYFGWVTNEALGQDPANPDAGHFTNVVGFAVPYQSIGCGSAQVNGVCATVCDYGL